MTIKGAIFSNVAGAADAWPGFVLADAAYNSGLGYGFVSTLASGYNVSGASDTRIKTSAILSVDYQVLRIDLPNGPYTVRCAAGAATATGNTSLRISNDDGGVINLATTSTITQNSVLVADNTVMTVTDWLASNSGAGGGPGVTLNVTKGYVVVNRNAATAYPRMVQFEPQVIPLTDATLKTDRTGYVASMTGGVTTAGSPVVTGLSSTSVAQTGMRCDASSVPYGTTIKSVDSPGQITLNGDGTGVTAATGLTVALAYPVQLYEAETAGVRVAPITLASGTSDGLLVYEADHTTPNPYLTVVKEGTQPWLYTTSTPLIGGTPCAFALAQPDGVGGYHFTDFSLPVVGAPNKLADAVARPRIAQLLTSTYLSEVKTLAMIADGYRHGYKGQALAATVTVKSLAELYAQFGTFSTAAGLAPGSWYRILLTGVAADWTTASYTYANYDFKPGAGGGVLITNAPGQQPVVKATVYTGSIAGVQYGCYAPYPGIETSKVLLAQGWRADGIPSVAGTVAIFRNCEFGILADPAFATYRANPIGSLPLPPSQVSNGVYANDVGEQLTVEHCYFGGCKVAISAWAHRRNVFTDNTFDLCIDDYFGLHALNNAYGLWGTSGVLPGQEGDDIAFNIQRNLYLREVDDFGDTLADGRASWSGTTFQGSHADMVQIRTGIYKYPIFGVPAVYTPATGGVTTAGSPVITGLSNVNGMAAGQILETTTVPLGATIASVDSASQVTLTSGTGVRAGTGLIVSSRTYSGRIRLVYANNYAANKATTVSVCPSSPSVMVAPGRQMVIVTDICEVNGVYYDNGLGSIFNYGITMGNGVSYAENNTVAGAAALPSNYTNAQTPEILTRNDGVKGAPNCSYSRNNVAWAFPGVGTTLFCEGSTNLTANFNSGGDVSALHGPFTTDGNGRSVYAVDLTADRWTIFRTLFNVFKGANGAAGVKSLPLRLLPGESADISIDKAETLSAITEANPSGTGLAGAALRWKHDIGEAGVTDGLDVSYNVG